MRVNFFKTPKPRKFSFHTRYYDQDKIESREDITVEKGSFSKYRSSYGSNAFEKEFAVKERNRKLMIMSILLALGVLYAIFRFSSSIEVILEMLIS